MDDVKAGVVKPRSPYKAVVDRHAGKQRKKLQPTTKAEKAAVERSRETATAEKLRFPASPTTQRDHSLDSRDGLIEQLKEIVESPDASARDRITAIDKIMECRGLKTLRDISELRHRSHEELMSDIEDIVLPELQRFGVYPAEEGEQ